MPVKLLTSGGGGVNLVPSSSIASDQTMYLPTSGTSGGTVLCTDSTGGTANGVLYLNGSKQVTSSSGLGFDGSNLLVGKTSATANGGDVQVSKGITFPATQVACSDANTLDDYEEGTCTISFVPTGGGSITLDFKTIGYQKVGNVVKLFGYINVASVSSPTGGLIVTGLPFTSANGTGYWAGCVVADNLTKRTKLYVPGLNQTQATYSYSDDTVLAADIHAGFGVILDFSYVTNY